jgi:hypothetical protein
MGYYFENEPQNIHDTIKKLFIYYSHSDPMGTDGQTDKQTVTHYSGISSHSLRGVRISYSCHHRSTAVILLFNIYWLKAKCRCKLGNWESTWKFFRKRNPRGAIHVNHLQVPCGAFLPWELSWRELVNFTNSYVDSTCFLISTCSTCGLRYGST